MGHEGRQLYICTADICFIIDSTPGKWSPQSPFLPPSPFFFFHLYHLFTFSCCCRHAAYISCSFRWVDFWSKTTLFLSPSRTLGDKNKDSAGSESPAVALEGNLSHLCTKHVTAQPRQCEKQWKKRKGTLITFLSLMLTLSPSLLISQASVFLWTLKGVFTPRLWLISHPFIWYRVQCRLCRFKKKKRKAESKMR